MRVVGASVVGTLLGPPVGRCEGWIVFMFPHPDASLHLHTFSELALESVLWVWHEVFCVHCQSNVHVLPIGRSTQYRETLPAKSLLRNFFAFCGRGFGCVSLLFYGRDANDKNRGSAKKSENER